MIKNGDLVRITKGAHTGTLGLVMFRPLSLVARVKILDHLLDNDYVTYHIEVLEKL